jgi:hypothetical protein
MKTTKYLSVILAAGLAGVALVKFGNASILASLPGDKLFAFAASVALITFATYDYSRRHQPLRVKARVLRPSVPPVPASWCVEPAPADSASRRPRANERSAA